MIKMTKVGLLAIGLTLAAPAIAQDKDPNLSLIKARQGEMQLRAFNAGALFGMAKGKIPYDAELASTSANNLLTQLDLKMGRSWAKGTDNVNYEGKTTALPKIWETYPEIAEKGKAYAKAVKELAPVAGNGLDALKGKISALGDGCKGCHDEFREKKN